MENTKKFDITVGSGIISIFQRQNFKLERVFSEFIDNSLQSFLDNKKILERLEEEAKCKISIIWDADKIIIKDNCFGMNEEEFGRSLKLKETNPNALRENQLSIYGMGLKYASVYLGDRYSISSTAYGSKASYFAEVDVRRFERENPKTIDVKISETFKEERGTIIEIKKLRIKKTQEKEKDLRDKLGIIYKHYIEEGILSITINKIPVKCEKLELRVKENGGKYYEHFSDSFTINEKTYEFSGWIGILNKGDQNLTGLNLLQANRCIELGYKPQKLFGKGNSFQNSRVVGEIVFSGENYVLSFNKDKFVWADDGAEEAFITKLQKMEKISYILKTSKELIFSCNEEKIKNKIRESFKNNSVLQNKENLRNENELLFKKSKNCKITDILNEISFKETLLEKDSEYEVYSIDINDNEKITLYVDIQPGKSNEEWIKLTKHEDGYLLKVNFENKFFNTKNFSTQASKATSNSMAILFATSMLKAQNKGLRLGDSLLLLKTINEIMGHSNE
ncbi:ATP-binding protein [Mycoplasma struthionis]|uniref:ATP-binding protein n=1 Tax=Mycoplasma struthionis TaxID=538220 RepID=A0A502M9D4_9MOLU|nr:ATP-binding protein [Mycoplasma struthionis]TPI02371.1 hypothetical protein FJM01_00785 [Mycoplasma struthionis]